MPTFEQGSNPANSPILYRKYQLAYLIKDNMSQFERKIWEDLCWNVDCKFFLK